MSATGTAGEQCHLWMARRAAASLKLVIDFVVAETGRCCCPPAVAPRCGRPSGIPVICAVMATLRYINGCPETEIWIGVFITLRVARRCIACPSLMFVAARKVAIGCIRNGHPVSPACQACRCCCIPRARAGGKRSFTFRASIRSCQAPRPRADDGIELAVAVRVGQIQFPLKDM